MGGFNEISPEVGITGTPVIDLRTKTLYVDAFTREGSTYFHQLHAIDIATGKERPSSPVTVNATISAAARAVPMASLPSMPNNNCNARH